MENKEINSSELLSRFIANLKYEQLPESVIDYTKLLIIDFFAASMGGYTVNKQFNEAARQVILGMAGRQESRVMFTDEKYPAPNAAFMNAAYNNGADMDDGHRDARGHPGCAVMSSVFALADTLPVSGRDVILAIVCGYEIMVRLSAAVQPDHVMKRGFHSTSTAGAVGAAVACAKLLGLDYQGIYYTLSLGVLQAAGLIIVSDSGQSSKPFNPARAAQSGVIAARFVAAGAIAPNNPLESEKGFFRAFGENINMAAITRNLGEKFEISGSYMKPYPSCRHTHPGAEAMLTLRKSIKSLDDIDVINLYIYQAAIFIAGKPENHLPNNADNAKFSLAYTMACTLVNGSLGLSDLENASNCDDRIAQIVKKIVLISDETTEDVAAGRRGARVEIILKDKTVFTHSVPLPKGDPEVPMGLDDLRNKLAASAKGIFSSTRQDELVEDICKLDQRSSFSRFMDLLMLES